jgi:hypothetical protein
MGGRKLKFHLSFYEDCVTLRARAESDNGDILGDMIVDVKPGETFGSYSYEQLREHG